jgi:aminoglycoside phosphotransferase (APT) family kinase protein
MTARSPPSWIGSWRRSPIRSDLGWLLVTWRQTADGVQSAGQQLGLFLDEGSVAGHYARLTGLDLCGLEFNNWRWACIMQGVPHRCLVGAMGEGVAAAGERLPGGRRLD